MDTGLQDKVAVVTGAASGIGAATARLLVAEGARVALLDHDVAGLEALATELGDAVTVHAADLSTGPGVTDSVAAAIAAHGDRVDVLVNNVGAGAVRTFDELTDDDWTATLELNFMSAIRAIRAVLPTMRAQGSGSIVTNASDLARQPEPSPVDYGASKAALLAVTTSLARAEGPHIRVNAVAPGPIWTPFWSKPGGFAETMGKHYGLPPKEAVEHEMRQRQLPLERLGEPEEVANAIVFLASDLASFVTSSVWGVDGGSIRGIL